MSGSTVGDTDDAGVAATVPGHAASRPSRTLEDRAGTTIGRYQIQGPLGAGGMGEVWAALDPALDRKVALKLLPPLTADRLGQLEARLRREAQSLARLDHPNVVAVYDVGVAAESVFIAMQLVDGETLDAHLRRTTPPPDGVIALFVQAAHGLAAAHAAGIVHRDIKPSNLLVDRRGRVYVGDFGLARAAGETDDAGEGGDRSLLSSDLTRTGTVMGTPFYMAPEQHAGAPATAQADQFSLCVALWEALFNQHPFFDGTWHTEQVLEAMQADRVLPPARAGVRPRVVRALRRGLRHQPEARWPSVAALADELSPRSRRALIATAAGGLGVAGAAVLTLALTSAPQNQAAACARSGDRLARRWTVPERDRVVAQLMGLPDRTGAPLATRAIELLDQRADRWRVAAVETCEATRVRHTQPVAVMERRQDCLERAAVAFEAAADRLGAVTRAEELPLAAAIARAGVDADDCASPDLAASPRRVAPAALVERVAALQVAAQSGGDLSGAPTLAAELETLGDRELAADVWWVIAQGSGDESAANQRAATRKAAEAATAIGRHAMAAAAWARAASTAAEVGDLRVVDDLLAMASSAATLSKSADAAQRVEVARASIAIERRELDQAATLARKVIADTEGQPLRPPRSTAFDVLQDALLRGARWPELEALTVQLERELATTLGDGHPDVLVPRGKRAIARFQQGDRAGARTLRAEIARGLRAAYGPDNIRLMRLHFDAANDESEGGNLWPPEAVAAIAESLAIARRALPADDIQLARVVALDARRLQITRDFDGAHAAYSEALAAMVRQDNLNEWGQVAVSSALLDQETEHCDRAVVGFRDILTRGRGGEAIKPGILAIARAGLGSCLTVSDPDAGVAELVAAAAELAAVGMIPHAAQAELVAADVELRRGRRAHGLELVAAARARATGDSGLDRAIRAAADSLVPPR